ncbi:hypothetical protein OA90_11090 [Labrenzia sp. OB1]|nr:hypothetical protein OA90_11090 [Labrenzia sp. OB1]
MVPAVREMKANKYKKLAASHSAAKHAFANALDSSGLGSLSGSTASGIAFSPLQGRRQFAAP